MSRHTRSKDVSKDDVSAQGSHSATQIDPNLETRIHAKEDATEGSDTNVAQDNNSLNIDNCR